MAKLTRALLGSLLFASCVFGAASAAQAQFWQCVTYAREASGIQLRGNAWTWWDGASGLYERGHTPKMGAVIVFKQGHGMRVGHVAMVSKVVDRRTVLLTHANWSHPGRIERDVTAIDVSDAGDWSKVRVWYGPMNGIGLTSYAAYGFIYPNGATPRAAPEPAETLASAGEPSGGEEAPAMQLASIE